MTETRGVRHQSSCCVLNTLYDLSILIQWSLKPYTEEQVFFGEFYLFVCTAKIGNFFPDMKKLVMHVSCFQQGIQGSSIKTWLVIPW